MRPGTGTATMRKTMFATQAGTPTLWRRAAIVGSRSLSMHATLTSPAWWEFLIARVDAGTVVELRVTIPRAHVGRLVAVLRLGGFPARVTGVGEELMTPYVDLAFDDLGKVQLNLLRSWMRTFDAVTAVHVIRRPDPPQSEPI